MGGVNFPASLAVGQSNMTNSSQSIGCRSDIYFSQAGAFSCEILQGSIFPVVATVEANAGMEMQCQAIAWRIVALENHT